MRTETRLAGSLFLMPAKSDLHVLSLQFPSFVECRSRINKFDKLYLIMAKGMTDSSIMYVKSSQVGLNVIISACFVRKERLHLPYASRESNTVME